MEIKVIKNNLLIELVIHSQINNETISYIMNKYKDCQVLEFNMKLNPNVLLNNTKVTDFESIAIILQ